MISGTITDLSGRTLSGQTPTAFWHSVRHARPFTIGLNCALGADAMRAHLAEISGRRRHLHLRLSRTPACRTSSASTTRARSSWRAQLEEFAREGLVNVVGGCCGTTPDHIRAIAAAVAKYPPRAVPEKAPLMRLSGLEPFTLTPEIPFVNVGERTNVTGSARFRKLITAATTPPPSTSRATRSRTARQIIDVNMDEGLIDSRGGDDRVPEPRRRRARHRPRAADDRLARSGR